jgi:glycosyltransferase involved in cell wall biosynthesis
MKTEKDHRSTQESSTEENASCQAVVILMSTHNGEKFVAEQIRSILAQSHSDFVLQIRDDGSTDATTSEIRAFLDDPRVRVEHGQRVGIPASFGQLLQKAFHAEVVLFSDQDDIWETNRVERAVGHLVGTTKPTLYGGAFRLFGENRESSKVFELGGKLGLGNALVQNRFPGCVSAFNGPLLSMLRDNPCPDALFHDHWAYLIASAKGELIVDTAVVLHKRVHADNATPNPGISRFLARVKRFRKIRTDVEIFDLPAYALSQIDDLGSAEALLQVFLSGRGIHRKLRLIVSRRFWRFPLGEDVLYRISLCTRKFQSERKDK